MQTANRAPMYATLYPGLCEIARLHGYALTIHGSMLDDLDFVAIPWVDGAESPEELYAAIKSHLEICLVDYIAPEHWDVCLKPYGRKAWKLFMHNGASVDLSVMPRA